MEKVTTLESELRELLDTLHAMAWNRIADGFKDAAKYPLCGAELQAGGEGMAAGYQLSAKWLGEVMADNGMHPEEA